MPKLSGQAASSHVYENDMNKAMQEKDSVADSPTRRMMRPTRWTAPVITALKIPVRQIQNGSMPSLRTQIRKAENGDMRTVKRGWRIPIGASIRRNHSEYGM